MILAGAGQLGSRYLQGLVPLGIPLDILVIDPSAASLDVAEARWNEVGGMQSNHKINWSSNLLNIPDTVDLAIISTSSNVRLKVIREICRCSRVEFWILEKLLAQSAHDLVKMAQLLRSARGSWVNTPRRTFQLYTNLKSRIRGNGPFDMTYSAYDWGLASNSVHFIDLFTYLTGTEIQSIDTEGLAKNWHSTKRQGFFDIRGALEAKQLCGSTLKLISTDTPGFPSLLLRQFDGTTWEIDEQTGIAESSMGEKICSKGSAMQSEMTAQIVADILTKGKSNLPSLEESIVIHEKHLQSMRHHWIRYSNRPEVRPLIT